MFAAAGLLFLVVGGIGEGDEGVMNALEKHLLARERKQMARQLSDDGDTVLERREQMPDPEVAAQDDPANADNGEAIPDDAVKKEAVEKMLQDLVTKKEALENMLNDPETQRELHLLAEEPTIGRLHAAAFDGLVKAVEALVAQAGADGGGALLTDGSFNEDQWTPLHFA